MPRQIVNIVNFIRALEPRSDVDLIKVVREQIRLIDKNGLRATFLLQYDALILPEYTDLLKSLDPARYEIGIWHEIVKPLTDACGIPWTGRWAWDWHCHCGFPVGYTKPEREAMIDEFFRKFKEVFGSYPRVFGSWLFDSHTVRYMTRKYDMTRYATARNSTAPTVIPSGAATTDRRITRARPMSSSRRRQRRNSCPHLCSVCSAPTRSTNMTSAWIPTMARIPARA